MGTFVRSIGTPESTSHRLSAGKSIYLESAIPDSTKEKSLDPKTSCGLDYSIFIIFFYFFYSGVAN